MPFGFLKRRKPQDEAASSGAGTPSDGGGGAAGGGVPGTAGITRSGGVSPTAGAVDTGSSHTGNLRGVPFIAITEDWRLRGRMMISGRLTDALNKREALAISDVTWGPPDGSSPLDPAPGLKSVDPYDLIMVTAGEDSLPPLTEAERSALKVHKVEYDVALELPPFRVIGTIYLNPGSEPERLLDRSSEMFVPVTGATAKLGDIEVSDPEVEVILVNRFYLRGVEQIDKRTGLAPQKLPGAPMGGTSWQDRSR